MYYRQTIFQYLKEKRKGHFYLGHYFFLAFFVACHNNCLKALTKNTCISNNKKKETKLTNSRNHLWKTQSYSFSQFGN